MSTRDQQKHVTAIYVRSAVANNESIEKQIVTCKEAIQDHGWLCSADLIFTDDGVGGNRRFDRPGLSSLLFAASSSRKRFDRAIVADWLRLGRDPSIAKAILKELEENSISMVSADNFPHSSVRSQEEART